VPELIVRPTAKFLKAGAVLAGIVFLGLEIAYLMLWQTEVAPWVMAIPPVILLWPASRALRRRFNRAVISDDRLRYETGVTGRSTRNIHLANVQDVRVDQRFMQRLFDIGDLSIETAGETSRLTIPNVDAPQALADEIMNRAHKGSAAR
jgi:uncharacterized membrane protein YdbT with pleckstrin-like domain